MKNQISKIIKNSSKLQCDIESISCYRLSVTRIKIKLLLFFKFIRLCNDFVLPALQLNAKSSNLNKIIIANSIKLVLWSVIS